MTTAKGCNQVMETASKDSVLTMPTTQVTPPVGLSINQRNLYMYFLNHRKKYKHTPCYVPRCPGQNSRVDQYLNALIKLEQYGLIRVDRSSDHYTSWIMLPPKLAHDCTILP